MTPGKYVELSEVQCDWGVAALESERVITCDWTVPWTGRIRPFTLTHHGGLVPAVRRRSVLALTAVEREDISRGLASGSSGRDITKGAPMVFRARRPASDSGAGGYGVRYFFRKLERWSPFESFYWSFITRHDHWIWRCSPGRKMVKDLSILIALLGSTQNDDCRQRRLAFLLLGL